MASNHRGSSRAVTPSASEVRKLLDTLPALSPEEHYAEGLKYLQASKVEWWVLPDGQVQAASIERLIWLAGIAAAHFAAAVVPASVRMASYNVLTEQGYRGNM